MPWVKIDDHFPQNPKIAKAGPLAIAMQVAGLCYCNRELTDGFIPRAIARTLLDWEIERDDGEIWSFAVSSGGGSDYLSCGWVIDLLVESEMWDIVDGGYLIHDYLEFQPSREQVLAERNATAKRVSDWRERRKQDNKQGSNGVTNAITNGSGNEPVTPTPVPVPVPVPDSKESITNGEVPNGTDDDAKRFEVIDGGIKPKPKPKYSAEFESFWLAYPSGHGNKARSYEQWRRIKPDEDLRREIMTGLDAWKRCDRWRNGYVKAAEVWLKDSWWEDDPPPAIEAETESLSVRPGATEEELRASMRASIRMMG